MQITFTGRHLEVTEALKIHVQEKFKKVEHHFAQIISAHTTLSIQGIENVAEMTVTVKNHQVHATGKGKDMYEAIDRMVDEIDSQLKKIKGKHLDHLHHKHPHLDAEEE